MRAAAAAGESDGEKGGREGGGGREGWPRVTRRPVDGEGGVEGKTEPKLATIRNAGAHGPHCPHSHPSARCRRLHEIHRSRLVYHSLFSSIHGGRPPQQVNGLKKFNTSSIIIEPICRLSIPTARLRRINMNLSIVGSVVLLLLRYYRGGPTRCAA